MTTSDLADCLERGSIATIGAALRGRRLSVREACGSYVARIERLDRGGPALNAVRALNPRWQEDAERADTELAAGIDRGPLHGMVVLLKDNILTGDGMSAAAGAAALAGFRPRRDAGLVRRLREAGAIILGKANMTEFADYVAEAMPSEWSGAGGIVRNPHGVAYGRGQGSSVGPAAAVAAGLCVFAIGSETQNSIQAPACHSSVVGFKPTVGAVSRGGVVPLVPNQDSPGPLARSVADAALVFAAISGPDPHDGVSLLAERRCLAAPGIVDVAGLRIGVLRKAVADRPDFTSIMPRFEDVIGCLARAGAVVVDPCDLPHADALQAVRSSVFRTEFKAALNAFLDDHDAPAGMATLADIIAWNDAHPEAIPYGQSLLLQAQASTPDDRYLADRIEDIRLSRTEGIDAALARGEVDVLIAPMSAGAKCSGKAGTPVVALPAGLAPDGTPFGITLLASLGNDMKLLEIAKAVEEMIGPRHLPRL